MALGGSCLDDIALHSGVEHRTITTRRQSMAAATLAMSLDLRLWSAQAGDGVLPLDRDIISGLA